MGDVFGSIASPAIEFLLKSAISLCNEEISLIRNFEKDLNELKKWLEMIRAFLNDAEKKQVTDEAVKLWLMDLEAVAFDADNVLDEVNYEVHRRKMGTGNKLTKKVRAYFSTRKMALDIRSVNKELNSINEKASRLGLQSKLTASIPGVGSNLTLTERETASNPDPFVVGREHYVSSMVEILSTHHDEQELFSVIPIVGMGGLGKTTLAKSVFHDKKIKAHFEKRIWVYVSENFDEMTLLKKILESLMGPSKDDFKTKEALLGKLGENLEAKRYLLVLDDVWEEKTKKLDDFVWEEKTKKLDDFVGNLRSITTVKGNGIIVTTRSETIASIMGRAHIQKLSDLTEEDCWSIIKEKVFGKGCDILQELEDIGRNIARKCQGLPLAAKVLGGMLRGKPIEKWRSIEQNELPNLGEDGNAMTKILKLSFDNLPSQSLKKCFAFCAIFPKGYQIQKSMLIHLWMAEGFLQSDDMETLGDEYFDLLLFNSLLQVGERDYDGNIAYYTMHDVVYDVAFSVLNESNPVRCIYTKSVTNIPIAKARKIRSLIFEGEVSDKNMLSDFKYLRGLVLIGDGNKQLPKIEHLNHLRYLDTLRTSNGCSPELMGNLYLLQTCRAKVTSKEFPEAFKKLINLRHVYVEYIEETRAETQLCREVVASPCLEYLELMRSQKSTSAMSDFPNLKTLHLYGMRSSSLLENLLVNITSLTGLHFEELEGLVCLPDVFFHNNQNLSYLRLSKFGNLRHLPPKFGVSLRQVEIIGCDQLEGLPENPHCLIKLTLRRCPNIKSISYNPGGSSPSLRELMITDCGGLTELPIELLETCASSLEYVWLEGLASVRNMGMVIACLQKMPHLTSLLVDLRHLPTDDFPPQTVGSFGSLRDLWISCGMEVWRRLEDLLQHLNALRKLTLSDIDIEAVPEWLGKLISLRELHLERCWKLRSLPSRQALKHLTRLIVYYCPQLNLRRDDDTSEWHKVSHIADVHEYQDSLGSNAGSAVEFLLQNLISLCKEKISLIGNFRKDLDKLKESLKMIQGFLNDAEEKQVSEKAVKRWLMKLEDVALDADNVLDDINYEVHHRKAETANKLKKKVPTHFSTRKVAVDIRSINEYLNSVNELGPSRGDGIGPSK